MFFNPWFVLQIVVASILLFVVAPHLAVASKPAARTLNFASIALGLYAVLPFARMVARELPFSELVGPLMLAVFWGGFALAAWQMTSKEGA